MGGGNQSFEDLKIWEDSIQLCNEVYACFRGCKDYGLRDQLQRSAVSIPSNIAEGFELHTNKAFIRHLYIAKGSCGELRTQILIAVQQLYISHEEGIKLIDKAKKLSSMIYLFIKARKSQIRTE